LSYGRSLTSAIIAAPGSWSEPDMPKPPRHGPYWDNHRKVGQGSLIPSVGRADIGNESV